MATTTTKDATEATDTLTEPAAEPAAVEPAPEPALPALAPGVLVGDQYGRTGIVAAVDRDGVPSVSWIAEPVPCYVIVTPLA